MAEIKVTFATLEQVRASVAGTKAKLDAQLGDLRRDLAPMVATWEGQAATDYAERQRQWDAAAAEIGSVLDRIGLALGAAAENYVQVEQANARRWA